MKIDMSAPILDLEGEPMTVIEKEGQAPVTFTLKKVAQTALLAGFTDESGLAGEKRVKRLQMALAIGDGKEGGFIAEDWAEIKNLINKRFPESLITGRAWMMIDDAMKSEGEDGDGAPARRRRVSV